MRVKLWTVVALSVVTAVSLGGVAVAGSTSHTGATASTAKVVVPNVVGLRMDQSTRKLHARGLRVNEECSGIFGCIVKANWWICSQSPKAGRKVNKYSVVVTYGARRGEC